MKCELCGVYTVVEDPEKNAAEQAHWDKVFGWHEDGTGANVCENCFNKYVEWYRRTHGFLT